MEFGFENLKYGPVSRFPATVLLVLLAGGLLGCGDRDRPAAAADPLPPPAWLAGVWTGTFPGTEDVAHALILSSGACRILNGVKLGQISGQLALVGNALCGSGSFFLPGGFPAKSGSAEGQFRFDGKAAPSPAPAVSMVLVNTRHHWDFTKLDLKPDRAASLSPALGTLTGTYSCEEASTGAPADLEVMPDGTIAGKDPSGTFTGTLTQPAPGFNGLQVTLDYTSATKPVRLTFTGLAFYRAEQGGAGSLVVMTDAGREEFSGIFRLSQPRPWR